MSPRPLGKGEGLPSAVSTEYDNNPPDEAKVQESGITASRIQCQVSGYPRRTIPPGCTVLTQGIDLAALQSIRDGYAASGFPWM